MVPEAAQGTDGREHRRMSPCAVHPALSCQLIRRQPEESEVSFSE
jgi:hypothetical protein